MNGKDFETICLARMQKEEEAGRATMGRYGVQASMRKDEATGEMIWSPIHSLPDFEGLLCRSGRQFVFDAKVSGEASFKIREEARSQSRQLAHMMKRARFGAICFYLVHFKERVLKKRTDDAQTWAFPVHPDHPFWAGFERGESRSITRLEFQEHGVLVPWNVSPGGRTERPDILDAILRLAERGPAFCDIRPGASTVVTRETAKPF